MKKEIQLILIITAIWLWWSGILYSFIVVANNGKHFRHWNYWDQELFKSISFVILIAAMFIGNHIMKVELDPKVRRIKRP